MKGKQKTKRRKQPKKKKMKISIFIVAVVLVVIGAYNIAKAVAVGIVAVASEQAKVIEQESDNTSNNDTENNDDKKKEDGQEIDDKSKNQVNDQDSNDVTAEEKQKNKDEQQQEKQVTEQQEEQINFKELFAKDVFVGDSIAEAIDYYGILNNNSVYAKKGETLVKSMPNIPDIASRRPNRVCLMFGMNDIEIYEKPEDFAKKYEEYIKQVRVKMPNATIYVQSILPVMQKASTSQPKLSDDRIIKFNMALKDVCQKNNVKYIDTYTFAKQLGDDYYEPDGIHFQYKFYPKWLTYIKNNL